MINIPIKGKSKRKFKIKTLLCKICGKETTGYSWSKYCDTHQDPTNAERVAIKNSGMREKYHGEKKILNNLILPMEVKDAILVLKCPVCGDNYTVVIHEPQRIVPAYCESHRNKYKRELYLKNKGGN